MWRIRFQSDDGREGEFDAPQDHKLPEVGQRMKLRHKDGTLTEIVIIAVDALAGAQ